MHWYIGRITPLLRTQESIPKDSTLQPYWVLWTPSKKYWKRESHSYRSSLRPRRSHLPPRAFEQYKAQREETPEAIRLSVPIIKDIIRAYRIPILEVAGYEADDVIGTLATEAGRQGITTYMMTPDKDYGQLVSDKVFMYRPKHTGGFEVMGVEEVKAKFDIQSPTQVIDMLGLMGDSSDNIPGCPGVGEKTAQKLVSEFGSIENLLEHTDQLKGALKTKVETNREMITFSKFLATIKIDVPIQLEMDALVREEADENSLRSIFEELEFRTLIDRVLKKIFPETE